MRIIYQVANTNKANINMISLFLDSLLYEAYTITTFINIYFISTKVNSTWSFIFNTWRIPGNNLPVTCQGGEEFNTSQVFAFQRHNFSLAKSTCKHTIMSTYKTLTFTTWNLILIDVENIKTRQKAVTAGINKKNAVKCNGPVLPLQTLLLQVSLSFYAVLP